jgi:transposase
MEATMKEESGKRARRKYDEQFRQDALQLIENGQSVSSVSRALGVSANLLHKWKQARQAQRPVLATENAELRARLRQVEQERDILKKALSIFSRPG